MILFIFCFSGCGKGSEDYFSYRNGSFVARLEGNQFGTDISCDIYCENGSLLKMVYHAPKAMEGITVLFSENGCGTVEKNGITMDFSADSHAFSGWLAPSKRLLLEGADSSSVRSLQKLTSGYLLTLSLPEESDPVTVTLDEKGFPTVISGSDFSFRVTLNDAISSPKT